MSQKLFFYVLFETRPRLLLVVLLNGGMNGLAKSVSTGRVLSSDDATVRDNLDAPLLNRLVVDGADLLELGLE